MVRLLSLGANVIAVSRTKSSLDSLKEQVKSAKLQTICVDLQDWKATTNALETHCGQVDFLINNAGHAHTCLVDEVPEDELSKVLDINLKAPINLTRMVVKGMKERRFGSIVNVSSVASLKALDEHLVYACSKAALDMATKISAKELGPYNIRVNSVNPTVVWTKMGRDYWCDGPKKDTMMSKIPLARFAEVKEVIEPIIFLLGEGAAMINGITLPIDGGFAAC